MTSREFSDKEKNGTTWKIRLLFGEFLPSQKHILLAVLTVRLGKRMPVFGVILTIYITITLLQYRTKYLLLAICFFARFLECLTVLVP